MPKKKKPKPKSDGLFEFYYLEWFAGDVYWQLSDDFLYADIEYLFNTVNLN